MRDENRDRKIEMREGDKRDIEVYVCERDAIMGSELVRPHEELL